MKFVPVIAVAILVSLAGCDRVLEKTATTLTNAMGIESKSEIEAATIERVFAVNDEGFTSVAYQINWHGQEAIVQDPINSTSHKVGDKIKVMVLKMSMGSKRTYGGKILTLQVFPEAKGLEAK